MFELNPIWPKGVFIIYVGGGGVKSTFDTQQLPPPPQIGVKLLWQI